MSVRLVREDERAEPWRLVVDGKVLGGSGRLDVKPLQFFSVISHRLGLTLAQVSFTCPSRTDEIAGLRRVRRRRGYANGWWQHLH